MVGRVPSPLVLATCLVLLASSAAHAGDGSFDVPITQSRIRDGALRYGVWVKVGDRTVEAMLDTGSTGLRVLPSVLPGDPVGVPTQTAFGSGSLLRGVKMRLPIAIGAKSGLATVEVVEDVDCVKEKPSCDVERLDHESYRIGGDGFSSEGYSAILGIGLPFRGTDVGNPLTALGVKSWIVDLPRPFAFADGHLILDPDASARDGFAVLDRNGFADGDGCIKSAALTEPKCGSVLFDTGGPAVLVAFDGVTAASLWEKGTTGAFSFKSGDKTLDLDFRAGETGGLLAVGLLPPEPKDPPGPFIQVGVEPYFTYDMLYDAAAHSIGLRKRVVPFKVSGPAEADAGRYSTP